MSPLEGELHIADRVASAKAAQTRLFILTPKNSPTGTSESEWRNVEMTTTVPHQQWIGMKFVCRNMDNDQHVQLEAYVDADETNQWKCVAKYADVGGWQGAKPGCDCRIDEILTDARPAVYFRTDYVDVDLKKFSVREILPLP